MKDKKPQFKSKSLPGLSKEELNKMTQQRLGSSLGGQMHVESGHLEKITVPWNSEEAAAAGKKGGSTRVENAKIPGTRAQIAAQDRSDKGAAANKARKELKYIEIFKSLPETGITWKMMEDVAVKYDYAKREAGRIVERLEIENHVKDISGRTRWKTCTYKKIK